jgi:hypothetical protein
MPDDKIGIILHTDGDPIESMLPPPPEGQQYSYKTWRNARFHVMRRMFFYLYAYDTYGNKATAIKRIIRLVSKPLYVYAFGFVMGKVLDLQKWFMLSQLGKIEGMLM